VYIACQCLSVNVYRMHLSFLSDFSSLSLLRLKS
jgi:hypothetical protein